MPGEGSQPNYDFGLEKIAELPYFDPERIAEQAVWPTVDHLWRGDWRKESFVSHGVFIFPGTGLYDEAIHDASLEAHCYSLERDETDYVTLGHGVELRIDTEANDDQREVILHHVQQTEPDFIEAAKDYPLAARLGVTYSFNTEDRAEITAFQAIVDVSDDGREIWMSERLDETQVEDMASEDDEVVPDADKFYRHDIDKIAAALSILGAPEQCLRALDIIKGQPVEVENSVD